MLQNTDAGIAAEITNTALFVVPSSQSPVQVDSRF
jgi:hypothetical protein